MRRDLVAEARRIIRGNPRLAHEIVRQLSGEDAQSHGLTERQSDMLKFIRRYVMQHGYSPSYQEMMAALGLASKSGVHRLVMGLQERGHLRCLPGQQRSIRLTFPAGRTATVVAFQ